jgi:hypothetical protein
MSTEHESGPDLDEAEHRLTVAEVGPRRDVVRVAVTGELDIGTAAALQRRCPRSSTAIPANAWS